MAIGDFRWNEFNRAKVAAHGVTPAEAEHVVRFARRPYPRPHKKGTFYVLGRGNSNRRVQVTVSTRTGPITSFTRCPSAEWQNSGE